MPSTRHSGPWHSKLLVEFYWANDAEAFYLVTCCPRHAPCQRSPFLAALVHATSFLHLDCLCPPASPHFILQDLARTSSSPGHLAGTWWDKHPCCVLRQLMPALSQPNTWFWNDVRASHLHSLQMPQSLRSPRISMNYAHSSTFYFDYRLYYWFSLPRYKPKVITRSLLPYISNQRCAEMFILELFIIANICKLTVIYS